MLSVIVPVYNEENGVVKVLTDIRAALDGVLEHEIILVDDGSTDKTVEKATQCNQSNLTVITHVENLGYGRSLYDGIAAAKNGCIAIIDGDGSYAAIDIRTLYKFHPQYDMVVGARTGAEYRKGVIKRPARFLFQYLVEYASGRKVPDVNSGLRIFKKDIVLKFQDSLCTGFSFTTTLTLLFLLNHYYVKYIPIDYHKREGASKVKHLRDTLRACQIIMEAFLYYNPIKLFLLIASVNASLGLIAILLNHFIFHSACLTIAGAVCIASFVPIFIAGLVADQLKRIHKLNSR